MGEHHSILSLRDMGYPGTGPGIPDLVEDTKRIIKDESGLDYKHIVITAGAAQAITAILHAGKERDVLCLVRFSKPYFSHYPSLAKLAGYTVLIKDDGPVTQLSSSVDLIDSPSNPEGIIRGSMDTTARITIWDATYANRIYSKLMGIQPKHDIMVGSFGKLFGLNGARLGWIATNDSWLFDRLTDINYHMTLGVSVPSQRLVASIIDNIDMDKFTREAALQIDCNREEMTKLEYLSMSGETVPVNGMFYWTTMDSRARGLLKVAGVKWIEGDTCGGTNDHLRLNLAQSRKVVQGMVKAVRKLDGKK